MREREDSWKALGALLDRAKGKPERLSGQELLDLGRLYRSAAADLSTARLRFPGDPVVPRLEALVGRGRLAVYARAGSEQREGIAEFIARGYWRRVAERPAALALGAALLLISLALGLAWGLDDPGAAVGVLPEQFRSPGAESGDLGAGAGESAALSSQIFTNNIQVSFLAFAGGLLAGLGTAVVLVYNGLIIGALAGIVGGQGEGALFAELVVPHGVLELSCFVVTAAAGFRMGWAFVSPGALTRARALTLEARRAVELVLGTAPWLVLAGLIEGFVTGSGLGLGLALALGAGLGAVFWGLVLWRGRPSPATAELEPSH